MLRSSLCYDRHGNQINLLSTDLREVDAVTGDFYDLNDFILDSSVWGIMKDYTDGDIQEDKINLEVVCPDGVRRTEPIIFNDKDPIRISTSFSDSSYSEIGKARKLLFSSKNKQFLRMFLSNDSLCETANYDIVITRNEASFILRNNLGIPIINSNRGMRVNMLDVFKSYLKTKKPGMIRKLYEDSLNIWEEQLNDLSFDEVYYYSRTLRVLSNEYKSTIKGKSDNKKLIPLKDLEVVKNLKI